MALKPPSKQKLLYQRAWLTAHSREDGIVLQFKTRAGAFEARRHLYEAVRDAKEYPLESDPRLVKAAEEIQIVWQGETGLHMRHRASNDATQGLEEALGVSVEQMVDAEATASMERMMKELGMATPVAGTAPEASPTLEHKANPFYARRDPLTGKDE